MKRITNKEEADFYFQKVNELIDEYVSKYKVRPKELFHYVNRNLESFLQESGLNDVDGIKTVVNNVLEHRLNMEKDKIMKFENFSLLQENVLIVDKSTVEHEKVLADHYNTSIGHIESISDELHLFLINDFGQKKYAIIFSDDELNKIKENILASIIGETKEKVISINEIDGKEFGFSFRFWLGDIVDDEKLKSSIGEKLTRESIIKFINSMIVSSDEIPVKLDTNLITYSGEFSGYNIWQIK